MHLFFKLIKKANVVSTDVHVFRMLDWDFNDMTLNDFQTVKATISMFLYMNVEKVFIIPHRVSLTFEELEDIKSLCCTFFKINVFVIFFHFFSKHFS